MSVKKEAWPGSELPAFNHLEALWSLEERQPDSFSLASRVALVYRAFMELPQSSHMAWAPRASACFFDIDKPGNPYAPSGALDSDPADSHANERHAMRSPLIKNIVERGELKTIAAILASLPAPTRSDAGARPASTARALYNGSFKRFMEAKKAPLIAKSIERGASIDWFSIPDLFARGGAALDHPVIAKALLKTIADDIKEAAKKHDPSARHRSYIDRIGPEHLTCAHPAWLGAIVSGLGLDRPTRPALDDLSVLLKTACKTSEQTEERAREHKAAVEATNPRLARAMTISGFSEPQRESARAASLYFNQLRSRALESLVKSDPVSAARVVIEWSLPETLQATWDACGLTTVDALDLITRPNDSLRFTKQQGHWPKRPAREMGQGGVAVIPFSAPGATLSALDCFALRHPFSESVKMVAENGGAFSEGLALTLKDRSLFGSLPLKEALWYESAMSNPIPKAPSARLRV